MARIKGTLKLSSNIEPLAGAPLDARSIVPTLADLTAAGSVTVTAYKDNVAIPGATATETVAATDTTVNLSLSSMIREGCSYCNGLSNVTFVVSGTAAEILNVAIVMEKK